VVVADETLHAWRYFAGTDDERVAGFHRLLDDPTIDMILMARGGYGLSRVLHRIDWSRVAASGKAFVGFSDFTAFNMAAYACANLVTYHGPMLTSDFAKDEPDSFAMQHFWMAVSNESHRIDDVDSPHEYGERRIEGRLWGGNLSLLANMVGTPSKMVAWSRWIAARTAAGVNRGISDIVQPNRMQMFSTLDSP